VASSNLGVFHSLPYPLRVVTASLRGYQLRYRRYGGGRTDEMVQETLERDFWSPRHWKNWRDEQLGRLLHRAATRVPWYRAMWEQRRRKGDSASWEYLENWPVLEKDEFRRNSRMFVADDRNPKDLVHLVTSGTTGSPTDIWESHAVKRRWYAQFEARCRVWHGVSRHNRWAHLGGKQVAPMGAATPPYWVWNHGLKQLYLSSYHLIPSEIPHYARAIREHDIDYLLGYPSSLYELARGILNSRAVAPRLKLVITDAEPLRPHQRRIISQAFGCPVRESYGMVEIAAAGSECECGAMHLWPDTGVVETFDGQSPAPAGGAGDFVCTGLVNTDMPLIRFRVGDRGAIGDDDGCACGRTLPVIRSIEGRISDMLVTMDGRRLAPANVECIYDDSYPIVEAQLLQHSLTNVTLRYVPAPGFTGETAAALERSVRYHLGPVDVTMERMEKIPRGPNGKMRAVVCLMSGAEREAVQSSSPS
jgi:phenylacetate-CoA ligase